jgi:hypothetical protein
MRPKKLLFAMFLLAGCAGTKHPQKYRPLDMEDVSVLAPGVYLEKLSDDTRPDSANYGSVRKRIEESARKEFDAEHVRCRNRSGEIDDSTRKSFETLIARAMRTGKPDTLRLDPRILEVVSKSDTRYTAYFHYNGFYRTGGNMAWGVTKGILIGVATFGFYVPVPIKSSSTLYVIVIDNRTRSIAYDGRHDAQDDPLAPEAIDQKVAYVVANMKKSAPTP